MDTELNIHLDYGSDVSLTAQLEWHLRLLISSMKEGERLPSERTLAQRLKISRVTVRNAINQLVREGLLLRCGRNGTQVSGVSKVCHNLPVNDLAFGIPAFQPTIQLRFLCFETLTRQQQFWQTAMQRFNQMHPHCQIVPEYLPAHVLSSEFRQYLLQSGADCFQYNFSQNAAGMAQKLPAFLHKKLSSADFFFDRIPAANQHLLEYLLPINCTMFRTYCNTALAQQYKIPLPFEDPQRCAALLPFVLESAKALPEDIYAAGRIWDYARHEILRHPGSMEEALREFCRNCAPVLVLKNSFLLTEETPMDSIEKLFDGKVFSLSIGTPHFQAFEYKQSQSFASGLLWPAPHSPCIAMGISAQCLYPEEAGSFLEFLLSDDMQQLLPSCKKSIPVQRKAWYDYAVKDEKMSRKDADLYITSAQYMCADSSTALMRKSSFLTYMLQQEWGDFARGNSSAEETVQKILAKWQKYESSFQYHTL